MQPTGIVWPRQLLKFRGLSPNLRVRSRSGGASLAGTEAVVSTGAGIWQATGQAVVRDAAARLTWRALAAKLRGRVMPVLIAFCDLTPPWPTESGVRVTARGPVPHNDGLGFSDGSAYAQPAIVATVAADVAEGLDTLTLNLVAAGPIQPGHHFSIDGRLHRIRDGFAPAGSASATFVVEPPLRWRAQAGMAAEFDRPECLMRLASDEALDLDLDLGRSADPSVSLVEYF